VREYLTVRQHKHGSEGRREYADSPSAVFAGCEEHHRERDQEAHEANVFSRNGERCRHAEQRHSSRT
jgi:hypothetical protein